MSKCRRMLSAIALLMAVGMLACSVSEGFEVETATSGTAPHQTPSPPARPTLTSTLAPPLPTPMLPTATPTPPPAPPTPTRLPPGPHIVSVSDYHVARRLVLRNEGPGTASRILLWVALIASREPYQELLSRHIEPSAFQLVEDEYGNQYAQFEFTNVAPGQQVVANLTFRVRAKELTYDLSHCQGEVLNAFLNADTYVESGNEWIRSLAAQLAQGQTNPKIMGPYGLWRTGPATVPISRICYWRSAARRESPRVSWRGLLTPPTRVR
jgi:hypothetical protein